MVLYKITKKKPFGWTNADNKLLSLPLLHKLGVLHRRHQQELWPVSQPIPGWHLWCVAPLGETDKYKFVLGWPILFNTLPSSKLQQKLFTLHSLAQVVSPPLFVDHRLIDLASGQVVVSGQPDVEETFVVPQIQVYLAPVIQHKHFPWTVWAWCNR